MEEKNLFFWIVVEESEKLVLINSKNNISLESCNLEQFTRCVKAASKIERTTNGIPKKITASKEVLNYLDECLGILRNKFQNQEAEILKVITEILKLLRNCTSDLMTQLYILEKTNILNYVDYFLSRIIEIDINDICTKVILQFLINLMSSNRDAGAKIFKIFYKRVKKCLQEKAYVYESSALIYYISLSRSIIDEELNHIVLDLLSSNSENEFLLFYLEHSIPKSSFWSMYKNFTTEHKVIVLELLKNMHLRRKKYTLPLEAQEMIAQEFLQTYGNAFSMQEKENQLKAQEVSFLLEMLASLSSDENYLKNLQKNKDILINAGVLLINIHKLGKEKNNCFTPVQKLIKSGENEELNQHPAFGFKGNLIRLIGNLCWKNEDMQNLTRTAELIPVILDCCNMDARNPFIIQWSVLAVRNLCENNLENQKIIAGLHQEGTVSSEVLHKMGITLDSNGENSITIVPLDSLKKA